jgi:HPt (histidine-containing phosphotransfer) domain-containing protein
MDTRQEVDPRTFNAATLGAVQRIITGEKVRAYLNELDREHSLLVNSLATEPTLQSRAHNIVSSAGMLGLNRMSEYAKVLENACRLGSGTSAALLNCRKAAGDIRLFALPAASEEREPVPPSAAELARRSRRLRSSSTEAPG